VQTLVSEASQLRSPKSGFANAAEGDQATGSVWLIVSFLSALSLLALLPRLGWQASTEGAPHLRMGMLSEPDLTVQRPANPELTMGPKALLGRWNPIVADAAEKFQVPASWIVAVMRNETGGRTMSKDGRPIVSSAGALGLMQLLPDTYGQMARQYRLGADPFNPHDNVFAAAAYLRWLHARYGFPAMFAAYNDGPTLWQQHLLHKHALPAQTRNYVASIVSFLRKWPDGGVQSARLVLTRPNGVKLAVDTSKIVAVRLPFRGEYPRSVKAIVSFGGHQQGVRENMSLILARLGQSQGPA
jgi:soluble lytic murein transglycosylase-like protein